MRSSRSDPNLPCHGDRGSARTGRQDHPARIIRQFAANSRARRSSPASWTGDFGQSLHPFHARVERPGKFKFAWIMTTPVNGRGEVAVELKVGLEGPMPLVMSRGRPRRGRAVGARTPRRRPRAQGTGRRPDTSSRPSYPATSSAAGNAGAPGRRSGEPGFLAVGAARRPGRSRGQRGQVLHELPR